MQDLFVGLSFVGDAVPVKSLSGAGFAFEDRFGAYLAAALLVRHPVLGDALGPPLRVDFQVAADNWLLDDVLVRFGEIHRGVRWAVSVKNSQQIKQVAPADFVAKAWRELFGQSGSSFVLDQDLLGLVTPPMDGKPRQHLDELLRLAEHQDPVDLDRRMSREAGLERRKLWDSFRGPANSDKISRSPGELLRRFRYLGLDLMSPTSEAEARAIRWCEQLVVDPGDGRLLWDSLVAEVNKIRTAGGYVDTAKLRDILRLKHSLRGDTRANFSYVGRLRRMSRARLVEGWRAVGVPEQKAGELADDPSVGASRGKVPQSGVVALVGDFGSGKSVTAERVHLEDIAAYTDNADQPIPVFLKARQVQGSLEDSVKQNVPSGVGIDCNGVRLVLDGLDETAILHASQLLEEARVLTRVDPNTRVLITMRPGLPVRSEETAVLSPLTEQDLIDLSVRLTGYKYHLLGLPHPVKEAVRYPLFALIALNLRARAAELPSSRALFIDALVRDALGPARDKTMANLETLARAATLSIAGSGRFSENDLGGPDVAAGIVATRLIVRDGANLRFALPVLEQHFGAYALLRGHIAVSSIVGDLATFEVWRYAFVMAVGIGSWEQICGLLESLGSLWPGAACWVINQAVSKRTRGRSAERSALTLPGSLECARRLKRALEVVIGWLPELDPLIDFVDQHGKLVTVGAYSEDGRVLAGFGFSKNPPPGGIIELDPQRDNTSPNSDPRMDLLRIEVPPPGEEGWPWRWSMEWVASQVESLLKQRGLPLLTNGPLRDEYEWSLARHVVRNCPPYSSPSLSIQPHQVTEAGMWLLSLLNHDPRSIVRLDNRRIAYSEIVNIIKRAQERQDSPFVDPWPPPDNPPAQWRESGQYSPDAMRDLIRRVYLSALFAYDDLSRTWFKKWVPTLERGAAMPIRLDLTLWPPTPDNPFARGLYTLGEEEKVVEESEGISVRVNVIFGQPAENRRSIDGPASQLYKLRTLRPQTAGWANLSYSTTYAYTHGKAPVTDLVYRWLWSDLHNIGFLPHAPRLHN